MGIFGAVFVKYAVMPGLRPRLEKLFSSGFRFVAYFIALVYSAVRLLPEGHPYMHPANMGRFGIRHVIAEAANNLVLDKKNIDQIILFVVILFGLGIMCVQVLLLGLGFIIQPVMAANVGLPTSFSGFFITENPSQDLAAMMMDLVFGVPGLFESCISTSTACFDMNGVAIEGGFGVAGVTATAANVGGQIVTQYEYEPMPFPYPIHEGLHSMFIIYNTGMLVVATFIAIYFAVTVIAETAQSGTPFGKRFNKVWAPLRFVFAFALLVPISFGMNGSQYAVLYAAKFGSGFASNGWILFNETLSGESQEQVTGMFGDGQRLASTPNIPEIGALLQFFYLANTCKHAQEDLTTGHVVDQVHMYLVKHSGIALRDGGQKVEIGTPYKDMVEFADGEQTLTIRFGKRAGDSDPDKQKSRYAAFRGGVSPVCGEVTLRLMDTEIPAADGPNGVQIMQAYYWYLLRELWHTAYGGSFPTEPLNAFTENHPKNHVLHFTSLLGSKDPNALLPPDGYHIAFRDFFNQDIQAAMLDPSKGAGGRNLSNDIGSNVGAIEKMNESGDFAVNETLREKGWAGAAIWYNKIAELNGAVTSAVLNIPQPSKYPEVMEYVHREKKRQDNVVPFKTRFEPKLADGRPVGNDGFENYNELMPLYWEAFKSWQERGNVNSVYTEPTGNVMIDVINFLFGTEGLFNMRRNQDVHPLAQLVGIGRSLVEASIRNLAIGVVGGAAGGLGAMLDRFLGEATATAAATFLVTIASVTLTAGFILFYVVPFLPFIYFFFAVGGWVKGIFEAMVGAPLWALAHIRIDGNGLPGQAAVAGYFLIFEIFLRPILIVFGLLASISTFSALVSVLNNVFDLVTSNLTGFDHRAAAEGQTFEGTAIPSSLGSLRSAIDQFFYTVVYAIIVYLMGMASFKMIDLVPNNILRWMGQSITTFNDEREDIAQQMVGKATVGSQQLNSAIGGGLKGITGLGGMRGG